MAEKQSSEPAALRLGKSFLSALTAFAVLDYRACERQWREAGCSWKVIREIERTNDYARKFGRFPWEGKGRRK